LQEFSLANLPKKIRLNIQASSPTGGAKEHHVVSDKIRQEEQLGKFIGALKA